MCAVCVQVVSLGMVNFFCMAMYASQTYLPSPGGALLTAWATIFVALAIGGTLYKVVAPLNFISTLLAHL